MFLQNNCLRTKKNGFFVITRLPTFLFSARDTAICTKCGMGAIKTSDFLEFFEKMDRPSCENPMLLRQYWTWQLNCSLTSTFFAIAFEWEKITKIVYHRKQCSPIVFYICTLLLSLY